MGIRTSKQDEAFAERYERIRNAIIEEIDYPTYSYEYMARELAKYDDTEDKPLHSRIIELIRRNVDLNDIESLAASPDTEEIFKQNRLNFDKWQSPDIQDVKINAAEKI